MAEATCGQKMPHPEHPWRGPVSDTTYQCPGRPLGVGPPCGNSRPHSGHTYDGGAAGGEHAWCKGNIAALMFDGGAGRQGDEEKLGQAPPMTELLDWWEAQAMAEAAAVLPKAAEYGSNSLMQFGRKIAQLQGREVSDEEALELGMWANAVQKVERWTDAVLRGERPSKDTIYDIRVYCGMALRNRAVGGWPFAPTEAIDTTRGNALYEAGE